MAKMEQASIQIMVYETPGCSQEAIEHDLENHLSKKYSGVRVVAINTPNMFRGSNCGAEAAFDIVFTNTKIPLLEDITSFLESIESEFFRLGAVHQEVKRFYKYL